MQTINQFGVGVVTVGLLLAAIAPVFASVQDQEELSASDVRGIQRRVEPNEVTLNGKTLFRVPSGSGGLSAAERADIIRERLEDIAAHYVIGAGSVTVTEVGVDTFAIGVDGQLLATVEPATARAAGAGDAEMLADRWAGRVRTELPKVHLMRHVATRSY